MRYLQVIIKVINPDKKNKKWRNRYVAGLAVVLGLVLLVMLCLSPIIKYIVEKNDEKWLGRQITIGWVYANPFTGYIHFRDVKFYEHNRDTVCLRVDGISGSLHLLKLLSKEYIISDVTLIRPTGTVIQYTKDRFNFSDIVEKFSGTSGTAELNKKETKFSMPDISIENGTFYFRELMTPVSYFIKDVNIASTGIIWNTDTIANTFSFNSGIGSGKFEGHITVDKKTFLYRSHIIIRRLDLKTIEQYLKDLSREAKFTALMNFDITANGDLKDARNIDAVGGVGIYDFHIGKTATEDLASFKKFVIKIDHLNPRKKIYEIDSMSLVAPFLRYKRYEHLDNVQELFGEKGSRVKAAEASQKFNLVIFIVDYIKLLTRNFLRSSYSINRVGIYRANLRYEDYTLNEKFAMGLDPLTVFADSLGRDKSRANIRLISGIKPYGDLRLSLGINPRDSSDFDLDYRLQKVNAAALNPFLLAYTSFPLNRGSIDVQGKWRVRKGEISSTNHVLIIDPRLGKKDKSNNNKWIPLKLAMFFARDRGNVIDYEIPVTGNLKNPKFHLKDVFLDALTNLFIKPATVLYRHELNKAESDIEKSIGFDWAPYSAELSPDQERHLKRVAEFLNDNPQASITVFPNHYEEKELEYISCYEAKKKYFLLNNKRSYGDFSGEDSIRVSHLSPKDSLFDRYIRRRLKNDTMLTTQQLCRTFVGAHIINKKYTALNHARMYKFLSYFAEPGVKHRLKFAKPANTVPFNGFSFYQLSYAGAIPESMKNAFEALKEYDNIGPRKKLKEKRIKTRRFFNFRKK